MSRYTISRQRVVEALELLGLPPSACMSLLMEPDKVTVEMTVQGVETGRVSWKNADSSEWSVLTADVVFDIVEDYPTEPEGQVFEPGEVASEEAWAMRLTKDEAEYEPEVLVPEDLVYEPEAQDKVPPVGWPPGYEPLNKEEDECEACRFDAWVNYYADQGQRAESDSKPSYNQGGILPLGTDEIG